MERKNEDTGFVYIVQIEHMGTGWEDSDYVEDEIFFGSDQYKQARECFEKECNEKKRFNRDIVMLLKQYFGRNADCVDIDNKTF